MHRAGGRLVKNVAGYDLMKLHTGALGTLGLIVEATFRVQPKPEAEVLVLGAADDTAALAGLALRLNRTDLEPSVFVVYDSGRAAEIHGDARFAAPLGVVVGFTGFREDVRWKEEELRRIARDAGVAFEYRVEGDRAAAFRSRLHLFPETDEVEVRAAGLPVKTFDLLHALGGVVAAPGGGSLIWFMAFPSLGVVRVLYPAAAAPSAKGIAGMRGDVARHGGRLVVEHAPDRLARDVDVWGPVSGGLDVMAGLKKALDPGRRFNPGRFAGGL
jgi:glycolate oxidase FAD binding subunit